MSLNIVDKRPIPLEIGTNTIPGDLAAAFPGSRVELVAKNMDSEYRYGVYTDGKPLVIDTKGFTANIANVSVTFTDGTSLSFIATDDVVTIPRSMVDGLAVGLA